MKTVAKEINISGPAGNIQAILDLPVEQIDSRFIAVNCHPHSLHGGTMTNKVVYTVSRGLSGLGIPSIRFNFRGVGNSRGVYDEGLGEREDLASVVAWMKHQYPRSKLILSGFSFGAFVSAFAAQDLKPELLISIAPPFKRFNFDDFIQPACHWKLIMGDEDELVDYSSVSGWIEAFDKPPEFITMHGATHFFHGRLVELREHIENTVSGILGVTGAGNARAGFAGTE